MKLKNLVKKGGVADIVTLIIIVGLVIALIVAVVLPMIKQTNTRESVNESNAGEIDTYVNDTVSQGLSANAITF